MNVTEAKRKVITRFENSQLFHFGATLASIVGGYIAHQEYKSAHDASALALGLGSIAVASFGCWYERYRAHTDSMGLVSNVKPNEGPQNNSPGAAINGSRSGPTTSAEISNVHRRNVVSDPVAYVLNSLAALSGVFIHTVAIAEGGGRLVGGALATVALAGVALSGFKQHREGNTSASSYISMVNARAQ
ncbi:hypothetical protein JNM87_04920 [Candidatus Saccharibacteria bacterium]|nr:hypothetical protein [Candidatus Saccharibacteria bacterium]